MLDKIYLLACNTQMKANSLLSGSLGSESDQLKRIKTIVKTVGTSVLSVATIVAVVLIAVNMVKAGIVLADSDKAGPENTAKAKGTMKRCIIGLVIVGIASAVFISGIYTWVMDWITQLWGESE